MISVIHVRDDKFRIPVILLLQPGLIKNYATIAFDLFNFLSLSLFLSLHYPDITQSEKSCIFFFDFVAELTHSHFSQHRWIPYGRHGSR